MFWSPVIPFTVNRLPFFVPTTASLTQQQQRASSPPLGPRTLDPALRTDHAPAYDLDVLPAAVTRPSGVHVTPDENPLPRPSSRLSGETLARGIDPPGDLEANLAADHV